MNCEKSRYIPDYLSGDLEGEDLKLFEQHFRSCKECSRAIAFLKKMGKMPKYPAPNSATDVIMQKIVNPGMAETFWFNFDRYSKLIVPAVALAAIFLILKFNPVKSSDMVKVTFDVPVDKAESVALVGDFNNWDSSKGQLRRSGRSWHGTFYVKPGRYQYMIVVDDDRWMADPTAKAAIDDGYGNKNSLIEIRRI